MDDGHIHFPTLIADTFGGSRSEARRKLAQGGVRLDDKVVPPDAFDWKKDELSGRELRVGKRQQARLTF